LIRSHDAGGPAVADHYRDVVRLGSEVFGRVELIGFTAQLSLVGHLWRRMHRSGTADRSVEQEIARLVVMVGELERDERTGGDLPLPAEQLRDRFTGMLESWQRWNAQVTAAQEEPEIASPE
jgi:hypothetical protein